MVLLSQTAKYAALGLIGAYAVVIAWKLYTGSIPLDALLRTADGKSSPARLQMLLFTVLVAAQYVSSVWKNPGAASMPTISPTVLAVLGGSHAVYLGGKAVSMYLPLLKKLK